MASYFYVDGNSEQQGPYPVPTLADLFKSGQIHAQTLVWNENMTDWKAMSDVPSLLNEVNPPQRTPPPMRGPPMGGGPPRGGPPMGGGPPRGGPPMGGGGPPRGGPPMGGGPPRGGPPMGGGPMGGGPPRGGA